jgi:hypothetical protein
MTFHIDSGDVKHLYIDRSSGYVNSDGETIIGFDVRIGSVEMPDKFLGGGVSIHFDDERDAVKLAKAILIRMGEVRP